MNLERYLILITIILFLIPMTEVKGCGHGIDFPTQETQHHKDCENHLDLKKDCCDNHDSDDMDDCNSECKCSTHYPTSTITPLFKVEQLAEHQHITIFEFIKTEINSIYFSIWQPPKIS